MSSPSEKDRCFAVYDRGGQCVAVGRSFDDAVDAARERLDLPTAEAVTNRCRVIPITLDIYQKYRTAGF